MLRCRVNFRCELTSPALREATLRRLDHVVRGTGAYYDVEDGPAGSLGLPFWTTVVFSADDGDYEALRTIVVQRIENCGLSAELQELTS